MTFNDSEESTREPAESKVYRTAVDLDQEPFEWAIYQAVAKALGLDPQEDEIPIDEQIDPEALTSLFTNDSGEVIVSFPVRDARITVRSDGWIEVEPR